MKYVLSQNPCLFSLTIDLNSVMVRDFSVKCLVLGFPLALRQCAFLGVNKLFLQIIIFVKVPETVSEHEMVCLFRKVYFTY